MRARDILQESIWFTQDDFRSQGFREQAIELSNLVRDYALEHCLPWLNESNGMVAYRGVSRRVHRDRLLFTHPVRQDRKPKDSSQETHEFFNHLIDLANGVANRSNSAFATPSINTAHDYGDQSFVVLPIGRFHYTWSPDVRDWYSEEGRVRSWWDPQFVAQFATDNQLRRGFSAVGFTDVDVDDPLALLQKLHADHWIHAKTFAMAAKLDRRCYSRKSVKDHILVDQGLHRALSGGQEIMIHADELLYLSTNAYGGMVNYRVNPF